MSSLPKIRKNRASWRLPKAAFLNKNVEPIRLEMNGLTIGVIEVDSIFKKFIGFYSASGCNYVFLKDKAKYRLIWTKQATSDFPNLRKGYIFNSHEEFNKYFFIHAL